MLQEGNWTYDDTKKLLIPPPKMEKGIVLRFGRVTDIVVERKGESKYEADFADFARLTEIAMVLKGR